MVVEQWSRGLRSRPQTCLTNRRLASPINHDANPNSISRLIKTRLKQKEVTTEHILVWKQLLKITETIVVGR